MVQVIAGSLQFPSALHVILVTPLRSNPVLHDWVAVALYVVVPATVSWTDPFPGVVSEPQSWGINNNLRIIEKGKDWK